MTVAELIAFLQTQPQDLQVLYQCYSEGALLEAEDIKVESWQPAREDKWVHRQRPDRESQSYLVFPGN